MLGLGWERGAALEMGSYGTVRLVLLLAISTLSLETNIGSLTLSLHTLLVLTNCIATILFTRCNGG